MIALASPETIQETLQKSGTFRFAAVISHPIQHYVPVFRVLAARPEFTVKVFYACDWGVQPTHDPGFNCTFAWDVDLLSGYDHEFMPLPRRPKNMGFWAIDHPAIADRLEAFQPHAIWLHGYGHRICWRAASWAKNRAALVHFGDSELVHSRSWWRRMAKRALLRWHFGRCDAFITIGDNNDAYYRHYGIPREKLFRGACPIDVHRFRTTVQGATQQDVDGMRRRYGFPDTPLIALWAGKLEPRKRPGDFVAALQRLKDAAPQLGGVLVGEGPLRHELERQIRDGGLTGRVRITGFVNQADMPLALNAGHIFVTTSAMDPHPLVVTESMALGLPIVASDRVGCIGTTDTARPGVNALIFPCGDPEALAGQLQRIVLDTKLRREFGHASYELATHQSPATTVHAVRRGLLHLRKRPWPGWSSISAEAWRRMGDGMENGTRTSSATD